MVGNVGKPRSTEKELADRKVRRSGKTAAAAAARAQDDGPNKGAGEDPVERNVETKVLDSGWEQLRQRS